jgi:hypothetical protein
MWALVEFLVFVMACAFVVTQLLLPAIRNTPYFPVFRKTGKQVTKTECEIKTLNELEQIQTLEETRDELAGRIERKVRKGSEEIVDGTVDGK